MNNNGGAVPMGPVPILGHKKTTEQLTKFCVLMADGIERTYLATGWGSDQNNNLVLVMNQNAVAVLSAEVWREIRREDFHPVAETMFAE